MIHVIDWSLTPTDLDDAAEALMVGARGGLLPTDVLLEAARRAEIPESEITPAGSDNPAHATYALARRNITWSDVCRMKS